MVSRRLALACRTQCTPCSLRRAPLEALTDKGATYVTSANRGRIHRLFAVTGHVDLVPGP